MALLGDLEAVRLRKPGQLFVAGLIDDLLVLLVPDIADALEKQQRKDVGFEICGIDRAAKDVGRLPEVGLEIGEADDSLTHGLPGDRSRYRLRTSLVFACTRDGHAVYWRQTRFN